jgi:hypothetical protein
MIKTIIEKKSPIKLCLCAGVLTLLMTVHGQSSNSLHADPDHIATGFEYRGVSDLRVGDSFSINSLSIGGMIDIRNESRFNQKILPNHNWRGFACIYYDLISFIKGDIASITTGLEHESAHPTMGLNEGNDSAYDKIYDGTYRNINLNSFLLRFSYRTGSGYTVEFTGELQFYFMSRNTPENPVNDLTWSEGISGGAEFRYPASSDFSLYFSVFDRYIFRGKEKVTAEIYYDTASGAEKRTCRYPLMNSMNTVSARAGIIFSNMFNERKLNVYCGVLYGNIYGFVDSREKRTVYSAGIEITH